MKKVVLGCFSPFIVLLFLVLGLGGAFVSKQNGSSSIQSSGVGGLGLSEQVIAYSHIVERYASDHGISEYVPYLLAIMEVESKGKGTDPMQSSESKGLAPNTIGSVEASIEQGVIHFKGILDLAKQYDLPIQAIIQSYNYGKNYINFLHHNHLTHDLSTAERYSKEVVAVSLGNTTGETYAYSNAVSQKHNKPYLYKNGGNFFYAELVMQYVGSGGLEGIELPIDNPITITSHFNVSRQLILQDGTHYSNVHNGVDLVNGNNQANIYAVAGGVVVHAEYTGTAGNAIVIKHNDGFYSMYGHLSQYKVGVGDIVQPKQVIGVIGTTGASTGIHLHLGFSKKMWSEWFDPLEYLKIE